MELLLRIEPVPQHHCTGPFLHYSPAAIFHQSQDASSSFARCQFTSNKMPVHDLIDASSLYTSCQFIILQMLVHYSLSASSIYSRVTGAQLFLKCDGEGVGAGHGGLYLHNVMYVTLNSFMSAGCSLLSSVCYSADIVHYSPDQRPVHSFLMFFSECNT